MNNLCKILIDKFTEAVASKNFVMQEAYGSICAKLTSLYNESTIDWEVENIIGIIDNEFQKYKHLFEQCAIDSDEYIKYKQILFELLQYVPEKAKECAIITVIDKAKQAAGKECMATTFRFIPVRDGDFEAFAPNVFDTININEDT